MTAQCLERDRVDKLLMEFWFFMTIKKKMEMEMIRGRLAKEIRTFRNA
jgi:hypothetical protein